MKEKNNKPRGDYHPYLIGFPNELEKKRAQERARELGISLRQYLLKLLDLDRNNCNDSIEKGKAVNYLFKIPTKNFDMYVNQAKANDLSLRAYILKLIARDIETSHLKKNKRYLIIARDVNDDTNEISRQCDTEDMLKQAAEDWRMAGYEIIAVIDMELGQSVMHLI